MPHSQIAANPWYREEEQTRKTTLRKHTRKQQANRPALIQRKMIQLRKTTQCNNSRTSRTENETMHHHSHITHEKWYNVFIVTTLAQQQRRKMIQTWKLLQKWTLLLFLCSQCANRPSRPPSPQISRCYPNFTIITIFVVVTFSLQTHSEKWYNCDKCNQFTFCLCRALGEVVLCSIRVGCIFKMLVNVNFCIFHSHFMIFSCFIGVHISVWFALSQGQ